MNDLSASALTDRAVASKRAPLTLPYPGLRPFQPDDSEFFFGRKVLVDEIVQLLRTERLVAIIGGSGSGKSSLILAGAIPRLRSAVSEGDSDFWVSVVSTPGTNHVGDATPLGKLAARFCAKLRVLADREAEARLERCVALLRQPDGLARMVAEFGQDLHNADGVERRHLRPSYLILIDQFEEVFHRTNESGAAADDCRHLVARVVEHAGNADAKDGICVALTMRSERLNDCPRFEGLPDAINRAFYLVRRLDTLQTHEAIEQPALRYLRKCISAGRRARQLCEVRGTDPGPEREWPDDIGVSERVMARLDRDSNAVLGQSEHADQLPLLQHLLFWTWRAAATRCRDAEVPDALTWEDLSVAVDPTGTSPLSDADNALEKCLELHCRHIFRAADDDVRRAWEDIFHRLAFREPNLGTYTQERVGIAALNAHLGLDPADDFAALRRLLAPWTEPHRYLDWDAEGGTIKVEHETLIRRWSTFRAWVDDDDRKFKIYVRLIEECRAWVLQHEADAMLAGGNGLLLFEDEGIPQLLVNDDRARQFRRRLDLHKDGPSLAGYVDKTKEFLELSIAKRERDLEAAQRSASEAAVQKERNRNKNRGLGLLGAALLIACAMTIYVTNNLKSERWLRRGYVLAAETQLLLPQQYQKWEDPQLTLRNGLEGSQFYLKAKEGRMLRGSLRSGVDDFAMDAFIESRVAASLRNVLVSAPWQVPPAASGAMERLEPATCPHAPEGFKFFRNASATEGVALGSTGTYVVAVSFDAGSPQCEFKSILLSIPVTPIEEPKGGPKVVALGLDSSLSNLIAYFPQYVQLYSIRWSGGHATRTEMRVTMSGEVAPPEDAMLLALPTRRFQNGSDIEVAKGKTVRLFDRDALPGAFDPDRQGSVVKMSGVPGSGASRCGDLRITNSRTTDSRFSKSLPNGGEICLVVRKLIDQDESRPTFVGEVYELPAGESLSTVSSLYADIDFGASAPSEVRVDPSSGWLVFRNESEASWRWVPWKLKTWQKAALDVFAPDSLIEVERSGNVPVLRQARALVVQDATQGTLEPAQLRCDVMRRLNGPETCN